MKQLAAERGIGVSTARKAVNLLSDWGLVDVSPGRPTIVRRLAEGEAPEIAGDSPSSQPAPDLPANDTRQWLDLEVRRLGRTVARLDAQANPADGDELRRLLADAINRDGQPVSAIGEYEMVVRRVGEQEPLRTFVSSMP
jgi:DNA-binding FadR family transcriptional regulator